MRLDRIQGQDEIRCDLLIRAKLSQKPEYVGLARGQRNDEGIVRGSIALPILKGRAGELWHGGQKA